MPFVHPWALFGLALASAPIIIHLLNRRRFKVVEWAAMEFLLASQRKNFRRIRLEQLILMALRVLLICVLILLVSRPLMRRSLAGIAERERLVVAVFDASMSMGYRNGSSSSYDQGITFCEQLMAALSQGDTWTVVVAQGPGRKMTEEPSYELEAARAAVARDRLPLSDDDSSIPAALMAVEEILDSSRTPTREVYIVTDMQRASWLPASGSVPAEEIERLKRLSRSAAFTLVDVGSPEPGNLAVIELALETPLAVAGGEATVRARVANYGPSDAAGVRPELFVDGFRQQTGAARDIPSGETAQWTFRHVFRQEGAHAVTVELAGDNLERDDRRYLAVDVRGTIRVLCVDGEPGGEAFTGEADYLRAVLRPAVREGEQEVSPFTPEVVEEAALSSAELPRYDAVVLANVPRLDEPVVEALASYVRGGGALVVFPGGRVDRAFYNERLYRDGKGILPCSLGPAVGDAGDRTRAVHIEEKVGDHPFVRLFRDQKIIKLSSPYVSRYFRLEGVAGRDAVRVVCRFDGGAPALVEGRAGKGRVVVFASAADDEWGDLPSWPMFQTLVHEVMTQVARDPGASRNLAVGEPLLRHLSPRLAAATARLIRPGASEPVVVKPVATGGLVSVAYHRTDRAGLYELTIDADDGGGGGDPLERKQDFFAVNVRPRESDLRRVTEEELRRVFGGFEFRYQRGDARRIETAKTAEAGELWRALAYALLAMALLESMLAHLFSR